MKIIGITTQVVTIPLFTTFKTALQSVDWIENILVTVLTDDGVLMLGYHSFAGGGGSPAGSHHEQYKNKLLRYF